MRLRRRIARWLVGPFVTLPDRNGVWVVQRFGGGTSATIEADAFRLRIGTAAMANDITGVSARTMSAPVRGRFVGTVKGR